MQRIWRRSTSARRSQILTSSSSSRLSSDVAKYKVLIKPSAAKEIEAVDQKKDRQRIVASIRSLAGDPRPHGCEKLAGADDRYRIRVGRYRVIYSIADNELLVIVVRVGHRKDVYR